MGFTPPPRGDATHAVLRFGPFELDPEAGELRRHGVVVRLQPQPFKVLTLLASRAGEVVSREEIRRALWGDDTFVEVDQGLGYCLTQVRNALGDDSRSPRYVQTLPRRGYRFLVSVRTDTRGPGRGGFGPWARSRRTWLALLLLVGLAVAIERSAGGGGDGRVRSARPADPEVDRLTLVASHHAALRTPEGLERAGALFREAVERAPDHAPAWAGLSETLLALGDRNLRAPRDAFDAAEAAARRAVALDPGLGAAHAALGGVAACRDWDWDEARRSYDRALALDPADSRVLRWYSHLMMTLDRREAALDFAYRAVEADPLSVPAHHELTCALMLAGRNEEAVEQARRARQLDLTGQEDHVEIASALVALGRADEALRALDDRPADEGSATEAMFARARVLTALGRRDEARTVLAGLLRSADPTFFDRARALAALGERERALEALERSVADREPAARWLAIADELSSLRDEPRFRALRRTLGIV